MSRPLTTLLALLLLGGLAGCGSGTTDASASTAGPADQASAESEQDGGGEEVDGTPATVDCPGDAGAVALPADFAVPLPEGTVVVDVEERDGGRTVVTGVVPAAEPAVLAELQAAYAAAGITLTEGETEARDAESDFTGSGLVGRWGIRALPDCSPEATRIDLVVRQG